MLLNAQLVFSQILKFSEMCREYMYIAAILSGRIRLATLRTKISTKTYKTPKIHSLHRDNLADGLLRVHTFLDQLPRNLAI